MEINLTGDNLPVVTCLYKTPSVIHPEDVTYHHGDLRAAILQAAAAAVQRDGVHAVNLRALARDVGVSHTAPRYHFGDKRGVLTALAVQGYVELASRLRSANSTGLFLDVGVAYVEFALTNPGLFQVLFQPDLLDNADADLAVARAELSRELMHATATASGASAAPELGAGHSETAAADGHSSAATAAWSIAHGFATLALSGAVTPGPGEDLLDLARRALRNLVL